MSLIKIIDQIYDESLNLVTHGRYKEYKAEKTIARANHRLEWAEQQLVSEQKNVQKSLQELASERINAFNEGLYPYYKTAKQITKISYKPSKTTKKINRDVHRLLRDLQFKLLIKKLKGVPLKEEPFVNKQPKSVVRSTGSIILGRNSVSITHDNLGSKNPILPGLTALSMIHGAAQSTKSLYKAESYAYELDAKRACLNTNIKELELISYSAYIFSSTINQMIGVCKRLNAPLESITHRINNRPLSQRFFDFFRRYKNKEFKLTDHEIQALYEAHSAASLLKSLIEKDVVYYNGCYIKNCLDIFKNNPEIEKYDRGIKQKLMWVDLLSE